MLIDRTVWWGASGGPVSGPALTSLLPEDVEAAWPVGDINGDGYGDVAFRGEEYEYYPSDYQFSFEAALYLMAGGTDGFSGFNGTPLKTFVEQDHDCGSHVTVADVDGDGVDELVVACVQELNYEDGSARIFALLDLNGPLLTVAGSGRFHYDVGYGLHLAALNDWDGDGVDEVLLGMEETLLHTPWDPGSGIEIDPVGTLGWGEPGLEVVKVTTDDLSGDGQSDLAVSWMDGAGVRKVTVWLGPNEQWTTDTTDTSDTTDSSDPNATDQDSGGTGCGCVVSAESGGAWQQLVSRRRASTE